LGKSAIIKVKKTSGGQGSNSSPLAIELEDIQARAAHQVVAMRGELGIWAFRVVCQAVPD